MTSSRVSCEKTQNRDVPPAEAGSGDQEQPLRCKPEGLLYPDLLLDILSPKCIVYVYSKQ